jgi:hypothetical protein
MQNFADFQPALLKEVQCTIEVDQVSIEALEETHGPVEREEAVRVLTGQKMDQRNYQGSEHPARMLAVLAALLANRLRLRLAAAKLRKQKRDKKRFSRQKKRRELLQLQAGDVCQDDHLFQEEDVSQEEEVSLEEEDSQGEDVSHEVNVSQEDNVSQELNVSQEGYEPQEGKEPREGYDYTYFSGVSDAGSEKGNRR